MPNDEQPNEELEEALAGEAALPTGPAGEPIHPFQATPDQLTTDLPKYIAAVLSNLSSHYLEIPRGNNFVEYQTFQAAYELLETTTSGFTVLNREAVREAVRANSLVLVVLRSIAGLSPPELADLARETQGVDVDQGAARGFDQKARAGVDILAKARPDTAAKIYGLIDAACAAVEKVPQSSTPLLYSSSQQGRYRRGAGFA